MTEDNNRDVRFPKAGPQPQYMARGSSLPNSLRTPPEAQHVYWAKRSSMLAEEWSCLTLGYEPTPAAIRRDDVLRRARLFECYGYGARDTSWFLDESDRLGIEVPAPLREAIMAIKPRTTGTENKDDDEGEEGGPSQETYLAIIKRLIYLAWDGDPTKSEIPERRITASAISRHLRGADTSIAEGAYVQRTNRYLRPIIQNALEYRGRATGNDPKIDADDGKPDP